MLYIVEYQGSKYGVFAPSYQDAEARVIENHDHMIPLPWLQGC